LVSTDNETKKEMDLYHNHPALLTTQALLDRLDSSARSLIFSLAIIQIKFPKITIFLILLGKNSGKCLLSRPLEFNKKSKHNRSTLITVNRLMPLSYVCFLFSERMNSLLSYLRQNHRYANYLSKQRLITLVVLTLRDSLIKVTDRISVRGAYALLPWRALIALHHEPLEV